MSPIGGVGINLAVQDAVATANILGARLREGIPHNSDLNGIQRRRAFPTVATQWLQVIIQNKVINRILGGSKPHSLPFPLKLLRQMPILRRIPARVIVSVFAVSM
jgi:2-polyprenyl-6-methoxyphenol hydroxylase-like FAD-dependent oxidoreductase